MWLPILLNDTSHWPMQRTPPANLVYVKIQKSASSSTAGVVRLIAMRHNVSDNRNNRWIRSEPGLWAAHGPASSTVSPPSWRLMATLRLPTLLLTMVRDPLSRAISMFYHFVYTRHPQCARGNHTLNLLGYLASKGNNHLSHCSGSQGTLNFMYHYMRPPHLPNVSPIDLVGMYSFVGVVERYNESMALLAHWLHLPIWELVALDAKRSTGGGATGNRDDLGHVFYAHTPIDKEPMAVREYASQTWIPANKLDYDLYRAADTALSRSLESQPTVSGIAETYGNLLAMARKSCGTGPEIRECLYLDEACAYKCVDRSIGRSGDAAASANITVCPPVAQRS